MYAIQSKAHYPHGWAMGCVYIFTANKLRDKCLFITSKQRFDIIITHLLRCLLGWSCSTFECNEEDSHNIYICIQCSAGITRSIFSTILAIDIPSLAPVRARYGVSDVILKPYSLSASIIPLPCVISSYIAPRYNCTWLYISSCDQMFISYHHTEALVRFYVFSSQTIGFGGVLFRS